MAVTPHTTLTSTADAANMLKNLLSVRPMIGICKEKSLRYTAKTNNKPNVTAETADKTRFLFTLRLERGARTPNDVVTENSAYKTGIPVVRSV